MKLLSLLLLAAAGSVSAATWDETANGGGDAGSFISSALSVQLSGYPASITQITGVLTRSNSGVSEADVYRIYISSPANFSATTVSAHFAPGLNNFDTQLFLFNSSGVGIAANDDTPTSGVPQSTLSGGAIASLPAGIYYLVITGTGLYPADSSSRNIFPNFTDGTTDPTTQVGPTGPGGANAFTAYTGTSNEGGSYAIALSGVTSLAGLQITSVSEPTGGTVLIVGSGVTPGQQATVQATSDLTQSFLTIGSTTAADANGNVQYTDTPTGAAQRFYRLQLP